MRVTASIDEFQLKSNSHFAAGHAWKGGHYELFIQPSSNSSDELRSVLKALWSYPLLQGCYLERDYDPSTQMRVQPCEVALVNRLYGVATLPNGTTVDCGSFAMDYAGEEELELAHWVCFYLPLGSLSKAYRVGAYPFGSMEYVSEWKAPVNLFLFQLAAWIFSRIPFEFGLVGFEVNPSAIPLHAIGANGIPEQRDDGILWNDGGCLKWYPATRP
jgi:hypothetical protein